MYGNIVKQAIQEKKITQQKIVEECEKIGIEITRSSISKILNNGNIPSIETSKALAKVLDIDEEELILEGYLEKAPDFFINYINELMENTYLLTTEIYDNVDKNFYVNDVDIKKELKKSIKNFSKAKFLLDFINMSNTEIIKENKMSMKLNDKNFVMNINNDFNVKVEDNSMEPLIPKNSKIKLTLEEKYKNGDIIYINAQGKLMIRGMVVLGSNIFLYPYNKEYPCSYINKSNCIIIGKVSSCIFDI